MATKRPADGNLKTKKPFAFISAPMAVDTNVLVHALRERGVETIRADDWTPGIGLSGWINDSIKGADYVIVVMGDGPPNPNVAFEAGLATGMGKQLLILSARHGEIPFSLSGLPHFRTDLKNREAINFWLEQILSAPGRTTVTPQSPGEKETHPIGDSADLLLERLRLYRSTGAAAAAQLIDIIHDAIRRSGVTTLSKEPNAAESRGADLAVWSSDLEPWVGNPLVIEVKSTLTSKKQLESVIQRLAAVLDDTRSPHGLLIYLDAKPSILYGGAFDPRVIVMSAEEFLDELRSLGLGDLLKRARNDHVNVM